MMATWYVLEDGRVVDPAHVAPDDAGALRHADGVAVAVGPYGPKSRGVDLSHVAAEPITAQPPRYMTPARGKRYQTR